MSRAFSEEEDDPAVYESSGSEWNSSSEYEVVSYITLFCTLVDALINNFNFRSKNEEDVLLDERRQPQKRVGRKEIRLPAKKAKRNPKKSLNPGKEMVLIRSKR